MKGRAITFQQMINETTNKNLNINSQSINIRKKMRRESHKPSNNA